MIYIGDNQPTIYLGNNEPIIYLGDNQVYPMGPFVGLRVRPKSLTFKSNDLTKQLTIKSSEVWSMTLPVWITASQVTGDTGETIITLIATTQSSALSDTISVTTANYSANVEANYTTNEWIWINSNVDRSVPFSKCRFYMANIPAGTGAYSVTEGAFCECPNINTDGTFIGFLDPVATCYGYYHKFNMVIDGGTYTDDWNHTNRTEYRIRNTLPMVATDVYEWDFGGTLYWAGIERGATSPIYVNGNLIQVLTNY